MYNNATVIDSYLLNVNNLSLMTDCYHNRIGLAILDQASNQTILGVDTKPLLVLKKQAPQTRQAVNGLYHTAFLMPDQASLGAMLRKLLVTQTPLIGGADHGYSEALYLQDPEDNGIEIYRDKPLANWDLRPDGQIVGVTEELDGNQLLTSANNLDAMPAQTKLGHIHLQVADLKTTRHFYQQLLGFDLKMSMGNHADFLAYGLYHHHLAANTWAGTHLAKRKPNQLGLGYYAFLAPNLEQIQENLTKANVTYKRLASKLIVSDPNGIELIISDAS